MRKEKNLRNRRKPTNGKEEEKGAEKIRQKDEMKMRKERKTNAAAHSRLLAGFLRFPFPTDSRDDRTE